jgi:hypothetical protein
MEEDAMEVKVRHVYDQSIDSVFKQFGDKAGVERKFKALGARNIKVEKCKLTKTSLDLVTSREVPVNAPSLLKKFLGEWNLAHQQEQWSGVAGKSYQGHATISIKGVPVTIAAKMVLTSSAKGCTNDVTLTIESSIPVIGGKLAEFVGQTSVDEMHRQYEHIKASLKSTTPIAKTGVKTATKRPVAAKPVVKAAAAKSVKAPASKKSTTKTPAKKTVAAKTAVAKPASKTVATKQVVKAVAAKPAVKKVAKAVVKKAAAAKPAAKKAATKVAAKPAAAKKAAPKKTSR